MFYDDRHEVSRMLGIPEESVKVHSMLVGGGFGGKEGHERTASCISCSMAHRQTN